MAAKKIVDARSALEACRRDLAAAEKRIAEIESAEDDAVDTAESHAAWRTSLSEAENEAARLARLVAKLENRIEVEAQEDAAKAQRQREIDAERSADAAAALLNENYSKIVSLTRETLRVIAEADQKIDQANRSRAADLDPLNRVEFRAHSGSVLQPRKIVAERIVARWCHPNGSAVSDDTVPAIRKTSETAGVIEISRHSIVARNPNPLPRVELRRFREVTFIPEVRRRVAMPLATVLAIPALAGGSAPGWTPVETYNPALVLDRLDNLEVAARDSEPEHVIELIPLHGDVEVANSGDAAA